MNRNQLRSTGQKSRHRRARPAAPRALPAPRDLQALFLARRFGMSQPVAALVASLAFVEAAR